MQIEKIPAYELVLQEDLPDIRSTGYVLRHKKTRARIMLIENDDDNKVFDITFRTPPVDSTGVAHILEHSVLCGSKHFPLKDPFVELAKGSLNTFLNAMTYPDKTTYPVASCNAQDFQNLLHVYLDAVFYPNIYRQEEIFRQEGWSYHLPDENGPLTYNGVVYNEMKGVFSSPDEVLERQIMDELFPDTTYGRESGGDPEAIPALTYEQFLDFHRRYYHPSNSFLYLYGNMDMAEKLDFIDREYLSRFEYLEVDSSIARQKPFAKMKELEGEYPVLEGESIKNAAYLSYNVVTDAALDCKTIAAFGMLNYALLSAPGAPLKKALLDAQIAQDIYGSYNDGILQPYFTIVAKGADAKNKEKFLTIIRETLETLVENGIDEEALKAAINYEEFSYREADFGSYPKGLIYGLEVLDYWLYSDENPFAPLKQLDVFAALRGEIGTGHFEELVKTHLLHNPHSLTLTLTPSPGLAARREKETQEKLSNYLETLSAGERRTLAERTKALKAYQEMPEDEKNASCIPMLSRSDIGREAQKYSNIRHTIEDVPVLHHDFATNGIAYLTLLFDVRHLPGEWIPYLGLLKSVLGYVDTAHYTYGELYNKINANTGGISCGIEVFDRVDGQDFLPAFALRAKALPPQLPFVFEMLEEILDTSRLEDTKRLYEIIARLKSRAQTGLISAGHSTAVLRASSYGAPMAAFQDQECGVGYYQFLEDLEAHFQERKDALVQTLQTLMKHTFRKENLTVSYTGDEAGLMKLSGEIPGFLTHLRTCETSKETLTIQCQKKNEGFQTSGQVQYVAQTGNFRDAGFSYTGVLHILKVILSYDYLWMNIRVKGGAYGCMSGFKRNGESFFTSYRDPHLRETLDVYAGIPAYLRDFQADGREMDKYIIGTISNLDVPKTPKTKGDLSMIAYFSGVTNEMLQKEREQVLNAQADDIRALAELVEAILAKEQICVLGSEETIAREKDVFLEVKHLTK